MEETIKPFRNISLQELDKLETNKTDVFLINTSFDISKKQHLVKPEEFHLTEQTEIVLTLAIDRLKFGGLLFVYGLPHELSYIGSYLNELSNDVYSAKFKYWITLAVDDALGENVLKPESMGLLMYLKSKPRNQSPFHLNTDEARVSHSFCKACAENVKDWGGKKHLMNPKGTALSDVWRDLPKTILEDDNIPATVLQRIKDLTMAVKSNCFYLKTDFSVLRVLPKKSSTIAALTSNLRKLTKIDFNQVYEIDCVSFLNQVAKLYPDGLFDLAFADPPYNLQKNYNGYDDSLTDQHYINWCNDWLNGMARTLKPGGSLFVLNLPKWCIEHAVFLSNKLEFRNWITWDALSDPRGKIMPAHYGLLYYTKPEANSVFNYDESLKQIDSPKYCLRQGCVKKRKGLGDDDKVQLSDIWFDVHRIKHKRDRDAHPCQLPEKLLERIIKLTTNEGNLIFDPFGGAGTTAIVAKKLNRQYVITELDTNYVKISRNKLAAMEENLNLFGELIVPRESIKRPIKQYTKKSVEKTLQDLTKELGHIPTISDIEIHKPFLLKQIEILYSSTNEALKACRIALRERNVISF